MQGVEFVNSLCCNYLTLLYEGKEDDFVLRMLTENMADGFLPLELRRMDGQAYLYYNISGMQSMEVIYAEKTIDREAFRIFMWHLHEAIEQSRELFLPGEGICLEPSALFWNLGTRRWEFLYMPGQGCREREKIQSERERLAEFLVMRIEYDDKGLADAAYRFYEEVCAGRMPSDIFPEKDKAETEEEWKKEEGHKISEEEEEEQGTEEEEIREIGQETEKSTAGKDFGGLLILLWCTAVAVTFLLGRTMRYILLPGGATIVLLTAFILWNRLKHKPPGHDPDIERSGIAYDEEENIGIPCETGWEEAENAEEEEKTIYMDIRQSQERKLYGIGKFRQHKIFMEKLPCTIGKDKTLADYIVSDTSVSRMHARFFAEEETFWMQDLNSTNGTYHNGLRMRPNEKVMLEPEDEVGFGRVQFVFR